MSASNFGITSMAHLTPLALQLTTPIPSDIDNITSGCSNFFKINCPSKWLAEEYIKIDSTFDTYLDTLKRIGKKKTSISALCTNLYRHYQSGDGQKQLKLLKQQRSTLLSKEIAKSSTHGGVYDDIDYDNNRESVPLRDRHTSAEEALSHSTESSTHITDPASSSDSRPVRSIHTIPESVRGGQKHFRDSLDDEHNSLSKSPRIGARSPPEMGRDDDDETAIEDLKVLEGQEVFDDEDGDEDNNGEAVYDDDVESIEDLANEVELIEKSEPGFHPLIRALYHAVRGTPFEKPMVKPELSAEQSFLYDFVWNSVDMFHKLPAIKKKDLFVALSGIVDLDVHSNFPEHKKRLLDCRAVDLEYPQIHQHLEAYREYVDDYGDAKEARLSPLKKRLEKDLSLFDDFSDEKIVVEILLILVKLSMPDQYRRPKLTETSTIVVWSNIWTILFESTPVSVQLGETILREAQKDQLAVRKIVGAGAAKGAKGASGRRLDFRLVASVKTTQSSSEFVSVTLCNNEHKAPDVDAQAFKILHRKNNRLNKSVIANGLVMRTGPTVFLDVQGFEGWWYALLPFKDVFLCCQLRPKPLALPTDEIGLASFLCSDSLEILLGYRKHILSLRRKIQWDLNQATTTTTTTPSTPPYRPRLSQHTPPSFYTPTTPRTKNGIPQQK